MSDLSDRTAAAAARVCQFSETLEKNNVSLPTNNLWNEAIKMANDDHLM